MVLFTVPNYFKSVQMCVNRVFYDALNSIRDDHVFLIQLEQIGFSGSTSWNIIAICTLLALGLGKSESSAPALAFY